MKDDNDDITACGDRLSVMHRMLVIVTDLLKNILALPLINVINHLRTQSNDLFIAIAKSFFFLLYVFFFFLLTSCILSSFLFMYCCVMKT